MPPVARHLVEGALDGLKRPALVLAAQDLALDAEDVSVFRIGTPAPAPPFGSVVLVASDVAALRDALSDLPALGRARMVGVVLAEATGLRPLRVRPAWPPLRDLDARTEEGAAVTVARFASRVDVAEVLNGIAYADGFPGHGGVIVARDYDPDDKVPPDILIGATAAAESPVLGRAPVTVSDPGPAPLDETLFNPIGFRREWTRGVVDLDPAWTATPALVDSLRDAQGVHLTANADGRVVAALAMSGVPLVGLRDEIDLDDPLRREEHSIRQRRAALTEHATVARRLRLAERAGVRAAAYPSVSILLPTRRPELLGFALRQVAKQRATLPGAEVELVLAGHGFAADPAEIRRSVGDLPHTILSLPADTVFGDVLRAAADAAGGDLVLKMDDDDWYGPDVVTDLLLARRYSRAELVGMPAEMVYLEPIRTTVRRRGPSENYGDVVAGGTMMIDRALLREVGGFDSVPRDADARLLDAVRTAGGSVYRAHGLGYLLRRTSAGHTRKPGLGYFLGRRAVADQWRGFRPSALLEHDESEVPDGG
jgi:hypothetical protein